MRTIIGDYEAGELDLRTDNWGTRIRVHWPADRELDEWITLTLDLDDSDAAEIASSDGTFSVGSSENSLQLTPLNNGRFLLHCSGKNSLGPIQADLRIDEEARAKLLMHFTQSREA